MDRFAPVTPGLLPYGLPRRWLEFVAVEADENNCLRRVPGGRDYADQFHGATPWPVEDNTTMLSGS